MSCSDVCVHLRPAREFIERLNPKIVFSGPAWTKISRYWIYYDAIIDTKSLMIGLNLSDSVVIEDFEDYKLGMEYGLYCKECQDGLMGYHPKDQSRKNCMKIQF